MTGLLMRVCVSVCVCSFGVLIREMGRGLNVVTGGAAIVIPGQSVAADKEGVAVNQRKQTLKELLTQTMHYSEKVRKGIRHTHLVILHAFVTFSSDSFSAITSPGSYFLCFLLCAEALMGLKDLFARFPTELPMHAMPIVERLSPRITDYDKAVRQTLLLLLRTTIFPGLPQVFFSQLSTR